MTKYRLLIAAALSAIVGLVFLFIGDGTDQGAGETGLTYIVLRYFHSLTWLLLVVFSGYGTAGTPVGLCGLRCSR